MLAGGRIHGNTLTTTHYRYTFGPMRRFGNLRVPAWAVYDNGTTVYEMVSLEGSRQPPEPSLFLPPPQLAGAR